MDEIWKACNILAGNIKRRGLLGDCREWKNAVILDFKEINYDGKKWIELAQDKDQCQDFVNMFNESIQSTKAS
jgi:hypothetical protein